MSDTLENLSSDFRTGSGHRPWWRDAVVYQVYIRSFADSNGDGIGDINGIRSKLPYLSRLGIDALWITPWYLSPQADGGYDVTDYRQIDPLFGTLQDAEDLISEAHSHGIKIIPDIVPKHTSVDHPWFKAALASPPGSPERDLYHFRPGKGENGNQPPNNWQSSFGGPAWTRITEADGEPGEWYLHIHAPSQPDLNWANPIVRGEHEDILRFWFDRGVDGFRIDVARGLDKDPAMPDLPEDGIPIEGEHPYQDREAVHEIYRQWRSIADEYDGDRTFVAEVWSPPNRIARYLRPDELHTAFNFDFLWSGWDADSLRQVIDDTLAELGAVGAPATWVLSNHDFYRHPNRYGRPAQTWDGTPGYGGDGELDLEAGIRRSRAAALLTLALPGGAYIYQGEELGLPEVEDLPDAAIQDPTFFQTGGQLRGRDGCRVPLPWEGEHQPFGFSPEGVTPWLPQPAEWKALTAQAQEADTASVLALYTKALHIRRNDLALGEGDFAWVASLAGTLAFTRGPGFQCIVNISGHTIELPAHHDVLLASEQINGTALPADAAVWLAL